MSNEFQAELNRWNPDHSQMSEVDGVISNYTTAHHLQKDLSPTLRLLSQSLRQMFQPGWNVSFVYFNNEAEPEGRDRYGVWTPGSILVY